MLDHTLRHKFVLVILSMFLIIGMLIPINQVNARKRTIRSHPRVRVSRNVRHNKKRSHYRPRHRIIRRHYTQPYPTVNYRIKRVNERLSWASRPKYRKETVKSDYGPRATFKTVDFIPTDAAGGNFLVQSLNVTPDGHYAYVGYGYEPVLKHHSELTRIAQVDLRHHRIKVGKPFKGGHGQAVAYNPKGRPSLWLLNDLGGPIHRGSLEKISLKSLRPQHQIRFNLKRNDNLGDSLAFDNHNNIYNENMIWPSTAGGHYRPGMILLHQGHVNWHHVKFSDVSQGLRRSPGNVVQALAYSPRTKRLYIEENDVIVSLPVNKLGHLSPRDVKETILRQRREYEGLSFDRSGHAYILMNHPKEIMRSTNVF
ncbi:hypothetical protein ACPOK3_05575 [Acetilactobacillus jinshanensis]|uniref:Uncharacterized protein n=2 Tax=Acetilactobacillus jinshanensis TaxID=1720083 RepID=A0A4P6ZIX0_9LACO|nr:hypothetical protein ELX58_00305 [Acetilactobacillus jinshanensis]